MGEVWRAEQTEPVRRPVALKLIKAGMDSRQVIARFEAERQALALMDHPCIAKVFDAGTTVEGRPYFAMEYVRGIPITNYCDRRRLTTLQRLRLFQRVCDGVQHAHQKAVIHRDLKPGNILVVDVDGEPQPKIIDFGVAKATTQKLTEESMFTAIGELIGTPEYMSPEQAEITREDVDTRTDVYSLGVILYELLVGALPFDAVQLRRAGFLGIVKMLREEEPPRPSARFSTLGERATKIAERRSTEPKKLGSEIRGDLDWIVMRALEKDRNRRFGSPRELSDDIARHLRHEPAVAGPPGARYRTGKFVRRHRLGVSILGASFLVLAGFATTLAIQSHRISKQRDQTALEAATANRVSEFLVGLFENADPRATTGGSVTVREILDEGADRIEWELAEEPRLQTRLKGLMGRVYLSLDVYDRAEALLLSAFERHQEWTTEADAETATILCDLGSLSVQTGRNAAADSLYSLALDIQERLLGPRSLEVSTTLAYLGVLRRYQANYAASDSLYQRALAIRLAVVGEDDREVADILNNMSVLYWHMGRLDDAEDAMRRCLRVREQLFPASHPSIAQSFNNLGALSQKRGDYEAATAYYTSALQIREQAYGTDHTEVGQTLSNLAALDSERGRYAQARETLDRVLNMYRGIFGEEHHMVAHTLYSIGMAYLKEGDLDQAERYLVDAKAMMERTLGSDHLRVGHGARALGELYARRGQTDRAAAAFAEALSIIEANVGRDHPDYGEALKLRDELGIAAEEASAESQSELR
jgi:non-specific serine/threonine protein kinase/serine/threonine-protein kinase